MIDDMHDDEIKHRLGVPVAGEPGSIVELLEQRIEAHMVRAMPEPFDPELEAESDLVAMQACACGHRERQGWHHQSHRCYATGLEPR